MSNNKAYREVWWFKSARAMAAAKITAFLRGDEPRVLALVGATGKKHAIANAARQAGIAVTHHDLAQGAVHFGRLGVYQLTTTGLSRCVHVIANATEQFLKDLGSRRRALRSS